MAKRDTPLSPRSSPLAELFEELDGVFASCAMENWDGYGAIPVLQRTYAQARAFLESYPLHLPHPEIGALPSGEMTFEWYYGPHQTVFASIDEAGELSYAAISGKEEAHETVVFTGKVPFELVNQIERFEIVALGNR